MNKKIIFLPASVLVLFSTIYLSCGGSEQYTETVYDTVRFKKVDTLLVAKPDTIVREVIPLNFIFTVQIGAFDSRDNAVNCATLAKDALQNDVEIDHYNNVYTVIVGLFNDNKKAESFLSFVKSKGYTEAFIRRK
ncbi:MAG: SPOR domain-containing protein [Ignavibacteria bacterium]|nr:SPOR domain-containing protein [Ignavibacteria bacterium]